MGLALKYLGIVFFLILVFLLLKDANATSGVIKALSGANTNAILALQGRSPTTVL